MKSIRTNPRNGAAEGDERIRTAVCAPSTDPPYEALRRLLDAYYGDRPESMEVAVAAQKIEAWLDAARGGAR